MVLDISVASLSDRPEYPSGHDFVSAQDNEEDLRMQLSGFSKADVEAFAAEKAAWMSKLEPGQILYVPPGAVVVEISSDDSYGCKLCMFNGEDKRSDFQAQVKELRRVQAAFEKEHIPHGCPYTMDNWCRCLSSIQYPVFTM